jgi:hypothetical protein
LNGEVLLHLNAGLNAAFKHNAPAPPARAGCRGVYDTFVMFFVTHFSDYIFIKFCFSLIFIVLVSIPPL